MKTGKKLIKVPKLSIPNPFQQEETTLSYPVDKETTKTASKGVVRETIEAIIIAAVLALFIRAFVVQAFKIPSGSMKPTLLVGDHILVNKFIYGIKIPLLDKEILHIKDPKHRDIVVFRYPVDPSKDFIKRVIGLPGDTVKIHDKKVYVNNQLQEEPYVVHSDRRILPASVGPRDNMAPIVVPPHSLFVMGDNRDESYDSRFWKFVDTSELRGQAFIIYWSWNQDGQMSLSPSSSYIRWNRLGDLLD